MQIRELSSGKLLPITLAADPRCGSIDYTNDQVWELRFRAGEPLAVSVQTTYGLRARLMRIFPVFISSTSRLTDPAGFYRPIQIICCFPGFSQIAYSPYSGIDVTSEYWVPSSEVLACRTTIVNSSVLPQQFNLEWAVLLAPIGDGQGMSGTTEGNRSFLQGRTANLAPIFFHTGGVSYSSTSFPSLGMDIDLAPGSKYQETWAHASLSDPAASLELAIRTANRLWDTESARIEMLNTSQEIKIETGNQDWDTAFALSQSMALSLMTESGNPPFITSRHPDGGFSRRGDGSDLVHFLNKQTALDAYYLTSLALPGAFVQAQAMVRYFTLIGPEAKTLPTPVLACLAWKIYETCHDRSFLADVFPGLVRLASTWFEPAHDRDADGFPEADGAFLPGFEEDYLDHRFGNLTLVEGPALGAFLVNEINSLARIGRELNQVSATLDLQTKGLALQKAVEATWNRAQFTYHQRDWETHQTTEGGLLAQASGPGLIDLHRNLRQPQRICIWIKTRLPTASRAIVKIYGKTHAGVDVVEEPASSGHMRDTRQTCRYTLHVFNEIERVEVEGITSTDQVRVELADTAWQDISLLLPLWAHIPDAKRAEKLVKKMVTNPNRYFYRYGMPDYPGGSRISKRNPHQNVHLLWNHLVIEGLLAYGYRAEAAQLFIHLMDGIIISLQRQGSFARQFDATKGDPSGERNTLDSLAPYGLLLDILGLKILSPFSIIVDGFSPFPRPITVKYRGLNVICQEKQTQIIFSDGQTATVSEPGSHKVSLM